MKQLGAREVFLEGNKRGIILFHAYTGSPNDVRMLGRYLNESGYTIHLPTFRGHGTENPENILSEGPAIWEEDVKNSIQLMHDKGIKELAVFGLSLGGVYAIHSLENWEEDFIGGGAFCSPLIPDAKNNIQPEFLNYARRLVKKTSSNTLEINRRMENIGYQLERQLTDIHKLQELVFEKLGIIQQPVFLAQAGKDELVEAEAVYKAEKYFIQTQPEIKWYPESGHVITVGPERQIFQQDVLDFVNRLPWTEEKE